MKKLIFLLFLIPFFASAQNAVELPYSVKIVNPLPVDYYYYNSSGAPYASTAAVVSTIPSSVRYIGQTVNVNGVEYWFALGITDGSLVAKGGGGGVSSFNTRTGAVTLSSGDVTTALGFTPGPVVTASNGITKTGNNFALGGSLTGNTAIDGNFNLTFGSTTPLSNFNVAAKELHSIPISGINYKIQSGNYGGGTDFGYKQYFEQQTGVYAIYDMSVLGNVTSGNNSANIHALASGSTPEISLTVTDGSSVNDIIDLNTNTGFAYTHAGTTKFGVTAGNVWSINGVTGTNGQVPTSNSSGVISWGTPSGGGGATWGSITGTLSSQSDLNTALSGKQGTLTLTTTGSSGAATLIGNTLNVPQYSGGGGGYTTVQNNGTSLTQRANLNFSPGITAADNSGSTRTDVSLATDVTRSIVSANGFAGSTTSNATTLSTSITGPLVGSSGALIAAVSGTHFKTINSTSILGSGNIIIAGTGTGRVYTTSGAGAVSDADLSMFPTTTGTDNTTVLQALLDLALTGPITIIWDGKYGATQLKINSNTTILATRGCGAVQIAGTAKPFIVNANRTSPTIGSITDHDVTIDGGIWHGNGHNSDGSERRAYTGSEGLSMILSFRGINNLYLRNITLYNSRTLGSYFTYGNNWLFDGWNIQQSPNLPGVGVGVTYALLHDGFKIGGPVTNFTATNMRIHAIDDAFSICSNDNFSPTNPTTVYGINLYDPYAAYGDIVGYRVENIFLDDCTQGFRLLTVSHKIDEGFISNVYGTTRENILVASNDVPANCYYSGGTAGSIPVLSFKGINVSVGSRPNTAWPAAINLGTVIGKFTMSDISMPTAYNSSTFPFITSTAGSAGATITSATVDNVYVVGATSPYAAMAPMVATTKDGNVYGPYTDGIKHNASTLTTTISKINTLRGAGSNRDLSLYASSATDAFAILSMYPAGAGGSNASPGLSLIPQGTGFVASVQAQIDLFNTDYKADATNFEEMLFRSGGSNGYSIANYKAGTGTLRRIWFDATGNTAYANANLSLETNGSVLINSSNGPRLIIGGTTATNSSSLLDLQSTTGALVLPRMSTTQRNALTAVNGMKVYDNVLNGEYSYINGSWVALGAGGGSGTVTSTSVVTANGFAGTVATATTTPAITLTTSVTGIIKGNGTALSAATAGTDYQAPITLTTTGTSGAATFIGNTLNIPQYTGGGGSGTVTSVSGVTANNVSFSIATATTTPAITISTTGTPSASTDFVPKSYVDGLTLPAATDATDGYLTMGDHATGTMTIASDATDLAFSMTVNTVKYLPAATLTTSRAITIPTGNNGDRMEIANNEAGFAWTLTGASVYLADGSTTVTTLLANTNYIIRKISGKWRIMN